MLEAPSLRSELPAPAVHTEGPIRLYVPKGAFDKSPKNRVPLAPVFEQAGFENVGVFDSRDRSFIHPDVIAHGIKGPESVEAYIRLHGSVGLIAGTDQLLEGALSRQLRGQTYRATVRKMLDLGIGRCRLRWLSPKELPLEDISDLQGRILFTSFPSIATVLLRNHGLDQYIVPEVTPEMEEGIEIFPTKGSDTKTRDYADDGRPDVAALEIVEKGTAARENNLAIHEDDSMYGKDHIARSIADISTNGYAINPDKMRPRERQILKEVFFALESASTRIEPQTKMLFTVPEDDRESFRKFNPDVSPVLNRDKSTPPRVSMTIVIPTNEFMSTLTKIVEMGATDTDYHHRVHAAYSAERSFVLRGFRDLEAQILAGDPVLYS